MIKDITPYEYGSRKEGKNNSDDPMIAEMVEFEEETYSPPRTTDRDALRRSVSNIKGQDTLRDEIQSLSEKLAQYEQAHRETEDAAGVFVKKYGAESVNMAEEIVRQVRYDLPGFKIFKNSDKKLAVQWMISVERAVKDAAEFGEALKFRKILKESGDVLGGYIANKDPDDLVGVIYYAGNAETRKKVYEKHFPPEPTKPPKRYLSRLIGGTMNATLVAAALTGYMAHENENFSQKLGDAIDAATAGDGKRLKEEIFDMTKLAVGLTRTFAMVNIAYVNVRQKDDIRSTIIAQLAHGSCVEIGGVSSKDQNWFEVDFTLNGQKHDGYMYGPSLTFGKPDNMEKCEAFEYGK